MTEPFTPIVSVVTPFLNAERFIEEAIQSVLAQTFDRWELILFDDGSTDGSTEIAKRYASLHPERIFYREHAGHVNKGIGPSRHAGILQSQGEFISFVDADDVLLPQKLARQHAIFADRPDVGLVYAATEYWHQWPGSVSTDDDWIWFPSGVPNGVVLPPPGPLLAFLTDGATLPCMGSIMARRRVIESFGGFGEEFPALYEDQAFLLKMSVAAPVYVMPDCLDRYRQHAGSLCHSTSHQDTVAARVVYLRWAGEYLRSVGVTDDEVWGALHRAEHETNTSATASSAATRIRGAVREASAGLVRAIRGTHDGGPRPGLVRFGSLRRTSPISRVWGHDRGRALDRYYIENFLEARSADIHGRVLEIGNAAYTHRFGGERVTVSDVLHVEHGHPDTTIVGDLTSADHIPSDTFDCIILTQTLQLIFDVPAAIRTIVRILKPGGVLLTTFPGITHTGDTEWQKAWYWSFTTNSARRLFHDAFGESGVTVVSHGNVLAAAAFLYGLADRELRKDELDHHDPAYDVVITVRAVKASGPR